MPSLSAADGLILLIYFFFVAGTGVALRPYVKSSTGFLLAGRAMPTWIGGLALIGVSLGGQELIAMGALGAHYGLQSAQFYGIGAIPAMLFAGLYMMPLYYGTKSRPGARSVPGFLRLRFDAKTRTLYACAFAASTIFTAGIALYAMARAIEALHVFDPVFYARSWPAAAIFPIAIVVPALVVLVVVWFGGLTGAMYNQVLEFFVMVAALLPAVYLGLRHIGGWSGLKAALPAAMHEWQGIGHAGPNSMGIGPIAICIGLGVALGGSAWCVDFRVLQTAFAAKDADSARRVPLIAAVPKVFLPLLVVLPGLLAISLPTPHTTTFVHIENGSIYHEIAVVSPAAEAGKGVVPAKANPATGKPILDSGGRPILDYDLATPNLLLHYLPTGLLGLVLAALLAGLMSGVAANVTAFNAVFTCDLYQPLIRKEASDAHLLAVARWAAVGAVLLAIGVAFAAVHFGGIVGMFLLAFSFVNAPIFATFLAGMFSKRTTGNGAFAGLVAGIAAAALHYALTLPAGDSPGLHGGLHGEWIAVLHRYPNAIAQSLWTAIFAFAVNLVVTFAVSYCTKTRPAEELKGLVYSLTPRASSSRIAWWKRPEALAIAILVAAIAINLFFL
ncbi:MAG: sodium:solute symporter family transporter [Terracidiphilus sp.]